MRPGAFDASALLFDFGGTLDANGVAWKERFFRLWNRHLGEVPRERFDTAFYASDDALTGAIPPTLSLRETVGRLGRGVARNLNQEGRPEVERVAEEFCDGALTRLCANSPLLARLAERYRLGVVSNFYGNLTTVCEEVGIGRHLTVMIDSAFVGYTKPDPRIFRAALARLEASPSETVFVGDSLERDMAGARNVGMRHILLADEASTSKSACCPGDRVVHHFDELRELLL